jgi:hypothetical protein
MLRRVGLATVFLGAAGAPVVAQGAAFIGTVTRDSNHTRLDSAEVTIAALHRSTKTGGLGEFRLAELAPGRYAVTVRHLGFKPLTDTVELNAGATTERAYVLGVSVAQLDSVRVVERERKYISPGLNAFEERRKAGFGHFLPDSVLRKFDNDQLSSIVRRLPGMNLVPYRTGMYAGSHRGNGSTNAVHIDPNDRKSPIGCWATVYQDGVLIYSIIQGSRGAQAPDFNIVAVNTLGGVEFYQGSGTVPSQYAATEYGCGTVLLWTRER